MLDGGDATRREAPSVAQPVDEVHDGRGEVAGEDEVAVRGVRDARLIVDRAPRRHERLGEHLAAIHSARAEVAVAAAVDIDLEGFKVEEVQEDIEGVGHRRQCLSDTTAQRGGVREDRIAQFAGDTDIPAPTRRRTRPSPGRIMHRFSLAQGMLAIALLASLAPSGPVMAQQPDTVPRVDERFVRAPRPEAPVVRPGACPFECCHYGDWKLRGSARVRRRPSDSAPISFGLKRGQAVFADSGFVRIDTIGLVVMRTTHLDAMYHTPFAKGDTLLVLDYLGEGQYNAWWRGYSIQVESFWDVPGSESAGSIVRPLSMRWWARVRDAHGRRGWIDMDKARVSGADACG